MPLTLAQLLDTPTAPEVLQQLLTELRGIGFTRHNGFSPGSVTATGTPNGSYDVAVKVMTAGSLGSAQVQYSTDGGDTYSVTVTVPGGGTVALTGTGTTLVFVDGDVLTGDSFLLGDIFTFELRVSRLPVTSWQPGSVPLTLMEVFCDAYENLALIIAQDAASGFTSKAIGAWMDVVGQEFYDLSRQVSVVATGTVTLTATPGAGPYAGAAGELWVVSTSGKRFVNEAAFTVPLGGSVDIIVRAEQPGASYNVANHSILSLVTTLAGVSVDNDPGVDSWLITQGSDAESDSNYQSRCRARWPSLGPSTATPEQVYDLWARTSSAEVTSTKVRTSPTVEGEVDVFLAGASGPVSPTAVTDVTTYIDARVALTNTVNIESCTALNYTVHADVFVFAGFEAQAALECAANIEAYNQSVGAGGTIYFSNILEQLSLPAGVRNVIVYDDVHAPVPSDADLPAADTEVPVVALDLNFITVGS